MVNKNERAVLEKYEKEGWRTIRCGAPDFVFVKWDEKREHITDFIFVEVKTPRDKLSDVQWAYRKLIEENMKAKYKIEIVEKD